jgi:hypothetical protein
MRLTFECGVRPPAVQDERQDRTESSARTPNPRPSPLFAAQKLRRRKRRGLTEVPAAAVRQPQALAIGRDKRTEMAELRCQPPDSHLSRPHG